ncbi:MAG: sensor domain-containing diguanylate cyclase [Candidatus Hydrogenedentota bacterium]|nr:MAG: sensor domain-containing diguanylate cyclase [Candidatus Hydrogenedentota bacterium]
MINKTKDRDRFFSIYGLSRTSPLFLSFIIASGILAGEYAIMIFLSHHFSQRSNTYVALVDSLILSGFVVPLLYYLYYRPTRRLVSSLHQALQQSQLARDIVANTAEGIMITDTVPHIIYVNDSFCTITGYPREEVIGKNPRILKSGVHDTAFYRDLWTELTERGEWRGEIWNRKKNGEIYLESLSISAIKKPTGEITHYAAILSQSFRDRMTGLANRHLLLEKLQTALSLSARTKRRVGILFIDLDGFKAVNDTYGHDVGDRLLQSVGISLKESVRSSDVPARFGGDEFVILLHEIDSPNSARKVGEQCLKKIQDISSTRNEWCSVTASIGVYVTTGREDPDAILALNKADKTMYEAKKKGKNCVVLRTAILDTADQQAKSTKFEE